MTSLVELKEDSEFISRLFVVCLIWGSDALSILHAHMGARVVSSGAPDASDSCSSGP